MDRSGVCGRIEVSGHLEGAMLGWCWAGAGRRPGGQGKERDRGSVLPDGEIRVGLVNDLDSVSSSPGR